MPLISESSEYKGNPVFKIWEVDKEGNKTGEYPVVSIGKKKLKALSMFQEEINEFLEEEIDL